MFLLRNWPDPVLSCGPTKARNTAHIKSRDISRTESLNQPTTTHGRSKVLVRPVTLGYHDIVESLCKRADEVRGSALRGIQFSALNFQAILMLSGGVLGHTLFQSSVIVIIRTTVLPSRSHSMTEASAAIPAQPKSWSSVAGAGIF